MHIVGIDRVIERAGVAKATLYSVYGSKDELIRAYLTRQHMILLDYFNKQLAAYETPRERLLGVFDILGQMFARPEFRGCAFMNARAEGIPNRSIEEPADAYRASVRSLFAELAQSAGAVQPENLHSSFSFFLTVQWSPLGWIEASLWQLQPAMSPTH